MLARQVAAINLNHAYETLEDQTKMLRARANSVAMNTIDSAHRHIEKKKNEQANGIASIGAVFSHSALASAARG
jgi:hypothetical protein